MDRVQKIGLANPVEACNTHDPFRKIIPGIGMIFELGKLELFEP